jgi:hypothetical protein
MDESAEASPSHPSDSKVQVAAEAPVLAALGKSLGLALEQKAAIVLGGEEVRPDGVDADRTVFVEVFARIGKMKPGQRHKVSTDALKLLAIREAYPQARLILAFVDDAAAASVSGWRAATLAANGIEIRTVDLDPAGRAAIEAAQARQKMAPSPVERDLEQTA